MAMLKEAWVTPHNAGLAVLSLESEVVEPEYARLHVDSMQMPDNLTPAHPPRHVVTVRLLDFEDLCALRDALDRYISARGDHREAKPGT